MKRPILILFHLCFWLGLTYLLVDQAELEYGFVIKEKHNNAAPIIYGMLINAIVFYGTCFWLIPGYLNQKARQRFYFFTALGLLLFTLLETFIDTWWLQTMFPSELKNTNFKGIFTTTILFNLFIHILFYLLALGYRLPIDRRKQEKREAQLEKEKLEAELKFLKAQIDPHTLFNGMNSIYHLIEQAPTKAQNIVLQFSDLIRYQLYECNDKFVSIEKEIGYLENYIAINKIRKEADATIHYEIQNEATKEISIAPLIFTAFIENAFKYLSNHSQREKNNLQLQLKVNDDFIQFYISNTVDEAFSQPNKNKGIGIINAKSRLDLIYGDAYTMENSIQKNEYKVNLKIPSKYV